MEHKMCTSCKDLVEAITESIYEDLKAMVLMTDIPHGSEPAEEDVEAVMWWQVSKYFKDKFNVGDYEEDDYDDEED